MVVTSSPRERPPQIHRQQEKPDRQIPVRCREHSRSGAEAQGGARSLVEGGGRAWQQPEKRDGGYSAGTLTCITGVSGGGKSTLTIETLFKAAARKLTQAREHPAPHDRIEGLEFLDKVIDIDQSPIGRTPRSNPATYTGAFTPIRDWFAELPEAKARGYAPGRFSFNVKGGRCEACQGDGMIQIEMHFLPTSMSSAMSARASATTARRWK